MKKLLILSLIISSLGLYGCQSKEDKVLPTDNTQTESNQNQEKKAEIKVIEFSEQSESETAPEITNENLTEGMPKPIHSN